MSQLTIEFIGIIRVIRNNSHKPGFTLLLTNDLQNGGNYTAQRLKVHVSLTTIYSKFHVKYHSNAAWPFPMLARYFVNKREKFPRAMMVNDCYHHRWFVIFKLLLSEYLNFHYVIFKLCDIYILDNVIFPQPDNIYILDQIIYLNFHNTCYIHYIIMYYVILPHASKWRSISSKGDVSKDLLHSA